MRILSEENEIGLHVALGSAMRTGPFAWRDPPGARACGFGTTSSGGLDVPSWF